MNTPPPPRRRPRRRSPWLDALIGIAIFSLVLGIVVGGAFGPYYYLAPTAAKAMDNQFGDQWLKTSVAVIEPHKVRYGKYPDSLSDLKFIGAWDAGALQNVRYHPNAGRSAYYLEVKTCWMGKPELRMPDEFWRGTGYDPSLKPRD